MELKNYIKQWINKLGLKDEIFIFIEIDSHPGISLSYDYNKKGWVIIYTNKWDNFHLIHKLGYVWLFKKYGILEKVKKKNFSRCIIKELNEFQDTIMDAISYLTLSDIDLSYKEVLIKQEIKELKRAYDGSLPHDIPIYTKIQLYILCYLKYFKLFPEPIQEGFTSLILYFLKNMQSQIIESSNEGPHPLTKEIFLQLHDILNDFDSIKNSESYQDILNYTCKIALLFPYWNKETIIEQFNSIYR